MEQDTGPASITFRGRVQLPSSRVPYRPDLLHGPLSTETTNEIFDGVLSFLEYYDKTSSLPPGFFRDLEAFQESMAVTLGKAEGQISTVLEDYVPLDRLLKCRDLGASLGTRLTDAVEKKISRDLEEMKISKSESLGRAESKFAEQGDSLRILGRVPSNQIDKEDWEFYVPKLASEGFLLRSVRQLEGRYLLFQNETYKESELTLLWLVTWRTLKTMQEMFAKNPETFPPATELSKDHFAIERSFFNAKQSFFLDLCPHSDVLRQEEIEDVVDAYISHVAKCHKRRTDIGDHGGIPRGLHEANGPSMGSKNSFLAS